MKYYKKLIGERVYLSPVNIEDAEKITKPAKSYKVTYNANGGTGSIDAATVTAGQSLTLSDGTGLTAPSNKTFSGWATTSSATAADVTSPYTPTGNITLYAVWSNAQ